MNTRLPLLNAAALMAALCSNQVSAHYLWLEPAENGAELFFGEAEMLLKERSPGRLDEFQAPKAFGQMRDGTLKPATATRTANSFRLGAKPAEQSMYVMDESSPVKDLTQYGLGLAKSNYYSRIGTPQPVPGKPLPLDLRVERNTTFAVLYKGEPVMGAKVEVIAPNTWMQEHKTDANGRVTINAPWKGQYILHVLYVDKTPSTFEGKRYESLRNHLTYTFTMTHGTEPGPAKAPKHEE